MPILLMNNNQCTPVCFADYPLSLVTFLPCWPLIGWEWHTWTWWWCSAQWTELISVIILSPHPALCSCYAVANYYLFMWRAVLLLLLCNCSWCWCMRKWRLTPGHWPIVSKTNIPSHDSNDCSWNSGCRKIQLAVKISSNISGRYFVTLLNLVIVVSKT